MEPVLKTTYDLPAVLQNSVGFLWPTLPAAQQNQLARIFEQYITASYVNGFNSYGGQNIVLLPTERDESLELGRTASMIASLGAHDGMTVRPLSSVRRFGKIEQDPLAAGRALEAESVLDGALHHHGDQLRVSGSCASMRLPGIPRVRTARDGRPSLSSYFSARSSRRLFVN